MGSQPSIYASLPVDSKSIRILTILPDNDPFTKLRCELKRIEILDSAGSASIETPFEALSYTWGEPIFSCPIICNGIEIKITANLFDALMRLRRAQMERTIWIDAICINQEDKKEKSIQVPLMKRIYTHAKLVTIWLGLKDDSTTQALKLIQTARDHYRQESGITLIPFNSHDGLSANLEVQGNYLHDIAREDFDDARNTARGFPSIKEIGKWEPLVQLLSRKWFFRCWIKQESALASVALLQVGPHIFSWIDLCHAIQFFVYKGYPATKITGFPLVLNNAFGLTTWSRIGMPSKEGEWAPKPLIQLLESTKNLEASVELDKVYSLLGLVQEGAQIKVTYDTSIKDLYTQVTRILLQPPSTPYTYPLQVLASANQYSLRTVLGQNRHSNSGEPAPSWPSWVARWDSVIKDKTPEAGKEGWGRGLTLFKISEGSETAKFCAGGTEYTGPVNDPNTPYEISLRGFVFAEISDSVDLYHLQPLSRPRLWDFVLDIWSMQQDKHRPYPTGESMDEAFAQMLTMSDPDPAAKDGETYHAIDFQHFCVAMYEQTISIFNKKGRTADIESLNMEWEEEYSRLKSLVGTHVKSLTFSRDLQRDCMGRTLFATKSSHMGIGDNTLQPGDRVCVFLGGRTPYILRPAEDHKYRFISECYLHGIMYGESLKEGLNKEKRITLI